MGDFDEEINRQQTYAEERANQNAGQDGLGGIGEFEQYTEEDDGNANGGKNSPTVATASSDSDSDSNSDSSSSGAGGASSEGEASDKREGENPQQDSEAVEEKEPDRPDLRKNDDIVARQLREAAEQETDPELKKRLWEEYYKYKGL